MKKVLTILACVAMCLSACSKEDLADTTITTIPSDTTSYDVLEDTICAPSDSSYNTEVIDAYELKSVEYVANLHYDGTCYLVEIPTEDDGNVIIEVDEESFLLIYDALERTGERFSGVFLQYKSDHLYHFWRKEWLEFD